MGLRFLVFGFGFVASLFRLSSGFLFFGFVLRFIFSASATKEELPEDTVCFLLVLQF